MAKMNYVVDISKDSSWNANQQVCDLVKNTGLLNQPIEVGNMMDDEFEEFKEFMHGVVNNCNLLICYMDDTDGGEEYNARAISFLKTLDKSVIFVAKNI